MSVVFPDRSSSLPRASVFRAPSQVLPLRVVLVAGSIAAALLVAALAPPAAASSVDPDLVTLLRGMALIKAGMALMALGLVAWRLGQACSLRVAAGYILGVWVLVADSMMIWTLSSIIAAAVIFHAGLFGLLILAWREGRFELLRYQHPRMVPSQARPFDLEPGRERER